MENNILGVCVMFHEKRSVESHQQLSIPKQLIWLGVL